MIREYVQKALEKVRKSVIFLLAGLALFVLMNLGMTETAWAAVETVKTFGLVESGTLTETSTFNDGSVVYVRVNVGTRNGGSYANVIIKEEGVPLNQITITVYDNGYLPDEGDHDTYYWGKFILQQGDGSGTSDGDDDILELSNGETATISADLDGGGDAGTTTITADYDDGSGETPSVDHSDRIPPVMSLSINPGTFSPDGDGVQDTAAISFTLDDNVSSSLYTRVEIRDSSSDHIIKRNLLIPSSADNPLSTGSHSYIWDGKDDSGNPVPDAPYVIYLISVDDAENSAQRTAEVKVETTEPEILDIVASPPTISPENGDGNYDTSTITFTATNAGEELTFKIYAEPACTTLVRNLTSSVQLVGGVDHSVTWDGKNDGGLYVNDDTYTCQIYAKSLTGEETTPPNTEGTVTIDNTAPSAPTNLIAAAASGGNIQLAWTASSSSDISQYNIYRATSSGGQNYSSLTYTVSSGITSYTDTSTSDGVSYYYVVRAQDNIGNIETNTNEVSAMASTSGPSFSSISPDKSAYKNGDTITLTVTLANHDTGCTFTADFSNIDDQYVSGGESVVNWGTDTVDNDGDGHINNPGEQGIYVITYLISMVNSRTDSSYNIPVTATNAAENSTTSSIGLTLDNTAPSAPTNLTATAVSGGDINLTWTASSSGDAAQYNIYRATISEEEDYTNPTYTVLVGTNTYTDTSTTDGVTYYYVVRAQDSAGNIETNTNEVSAQTSISTALSAPTNLSATALSGDGIELTWTASSPETDVSQYNIYRATTSGGEDYTSPTYTVLVGTTSYTDTSTTAEVTYYYVVRAQDSAGNIETNTNEVSATAGIPDTTPPPPPYFGISSFDSTTGKIVISGTTGADASQPQEVEIFLNGSSQGTTVADANGDFTTENFTPGIILVSGHNSITVRATDKVGNKGSLSAPLKLNYKPQNLLSIVIRSTHVVSSGSSTKPIKVFYSVSQSALVTICIYNLKGELVREESQECAGSGEWNWFGKNMYEEDVNNGVYILRVTASAGSESETVTKLVGVLR